MVRMKMSRDGGSRRERWQRILTQQRRSGLSIKAFCGREGVSYQSFFLWKRKLANVAAQPGLAQEKVTFVPVTVLPQVASGRIEIELPGQLRVCVHGPVDRQLLADVLAVLGAVAC
jgi:transposase